jgi:sugar lactone lactonase YvrE
MPPKFVAFALGPFACAEEISDCPARWTLYIRGLMKLDLFRSVLACALLLGAGFARSQDNLKVAWELTEGVQAPESAYYDAASKSLFLSQIGAGGGKAKDGDGWITKLTLEGKVTTAKWFTGLNAPKGLRRANGVLWVSDIDRLVGIEIATGKQHAAHEIEDAQFLNDVAAGPDGTIYVSDMPASTIYQLKDGKISVLDGGQHLDSPNGLLVDGDHLLIGGWGKDLDESFTEKVQGRLLSLDLKTKEVTAITKSPTGNLDGVELDGGGGYFVTDWKAGKLMHISAGGAVKIIATLPLGTADHAYLPAQKLLILPRMMENKVTAFDLTDFKP